MRRLLVFLLLAGCGGRSALHVPSGVEAACAPDLPAIEAPKPLDCTFASPGDDTPLLAGITGTTLFLLRANGEATPLFTFATAPAFPEHHIGSMAVLSRGRWIAAMLVHTNKSFTSAAFERVIVSVSGELAYHEQTVTGQGEGPSNSHEIAIRGDGRVFAFGYGFLGGGERVDVVTQDGTLLASHAPFLPVTDPDERARMGIGGTDGAAIHDPFGWLDTCDTLAPSAYQQLPSKPSFTALGPYVVYPSLGAAALVREGPGGVTPYSLPPALQTSPAIFATHPAGFAVEGSYQHGTFAAVNVFTDQVRSFDLVIPPGLSRAFSPGIGPFDPTIQEIGVDGQGSLMIGLHDGSFTSLFTTADGATFVPIGVRYKGTQGVRAVERGGSYLISALGGSVEQPPPGADWIDAPSLQLARPSQGISKVIVYTPGGGFYSWLYKMSHDGRCVSRLDSTIGEPSHLEIWSADTGASHVFELPWAGEPGFNEVASTFIGGDDATPVY